MGNKSTPQAPNYTQLATEQAASSAALTAQQNWANRPQQNTPFGNISWSATPGVDPGTGDPITQWTQNESLPGDLQGALDAQLNMQNARANLASGMQGRVQNDMNTPFNWAGIDANDPAGKAVATDRTGALADQLNVPMQGYNTSAPQQTYLNTNAPQQYGLNTSVQQQNLDTSSPTQLTSGQESLSPTTQSTNEAAFSQQRDQYEQQLMQRLQPTHDRQLAQLQTQLVNQGITPGSDAYKAQMQSLMDQQSRDQFDAMQQAGQEQANQQGMLLGQQQQAFGQQQQAGQFGLGAQQQAYGQDLQSQQEQNAAKQAMFQQALSSGQFSNEALQNMFGQGVQSQQAGNAAQQAQFQQYLSGQQGQNAAIQAQNQSNLSQGQFYNAAVQQDFSQDATARQQNFSQEMAASQYQNQLRQQAISEEAQRRGMSLNEMNALMSGQQVSQPTMPTFNANASSQPVNYLQAGQLQGQSNLDSFNAQQAGQNSALSGIMGLGSTAMMM